MIGTYGIFVKNKNIKYNYNVFINNLEDIWLLHFFLFVYIFIYLFFYFFYNFFLKNTK